MKVIKSKSRKPVIVFLLAIANKVLAFIWLVIVILVVLVGAVVVYQLLRTVKRILPDGDSVDYNVTRVWLASTNHDGWVYDNAPGASLVTSSVSQRVGSDGKFISFALQYGIGSVDLSGPSGWVSAGTVLQPVIFHDSVGDDLNNYSFTMTGYGQDIKITCVDGVYSSELLSVDTNTYHVVLQWSSDMLGWVPIYTNNACGVKTAEDFNDTEAPAGVGFYRLEISVTPN